MELNTIHNQELQLANAFIKYTGKNIFLTGKAGTGKTTFLRRLKEHSPKRMIVVAPTGVAAINAKGVTIHSFFQVSFGPQIPGYSGVEQGIKRFSREKRNIMKSLDLLVIDEISMVRADLLDAIDETLRRFRQNNQPFGGIQLLMIGDLQQLAPVVKEEEWIILRKHYETAYFFSSKALQKTNYISIVLQHVYRQSDHQFINLLNKIRDSRIDNEVIDQLNNRYIPGFDPADENYIILTTHNVKANDINKEKLDAIAGNAHNFKAEVNGLFPEYSFPTEVNLELKSGAQVMFVKNDPNPEKRYFNGKIGVVVDIEDEGVVVQCPEDENPINVLAIDWDNIKYSVDEETKDIKETVEGTFTQLPLKLAWAITIHKSQGLTFNKAIIDSEKAFAHGQVYVALSRCRSLEGLVLSSPFSPYSLKPDSTIESFNRDAEENQPDNKLLEKSKNEYQEQLLIDLFNFEPLQKNLYRFQKILSDFQNSLQPGIVEIYKNAITLFTHEVLDISIKFKNQIRQLLLKESNAEENTELEERIKKASVYFSEKIHSSIEEKHGAFLIETDNKEIKRLVKKAADNLSQEVEFKMACLRACHHGFKMNEYLTSKAKASLEQPVNKRASAKGKVPVSGDLKNPDLYNFLKEWRNAKSAELGLPYYMVLPIKSMRALSNQVPSDLNALKIVHGFGKKKIEKFGSEILDLLNDYRKDHDLVRSAPANISVAKKYPKKHTTTISQELWLKLKDIKKVAKERNMVVSTIEGHIAQLIEKGKLPVTDFLNQEKLSRLIGFFEDYPEVNLSEAKQQLDNEFSYAELRFTQAHIKRKVK